MPTAVTLLLSVTRRYYDGWLPETSLLSDPAMPRRRSTRELLHSWNSIRGDQFNVAELGVHFPPLLRWT